MLPNDRFPRSWTERNVYLMEHDTKIWRAGISVQDRSQATAMRLAHTHSSGKDWVAIYFRAPLSNNKLIDQTSIPLTGNYKDNLDEAVQWFTRKWPNAKSYIICHE